MKPEKQKLPDAVKACLWSYDTDKMDFSIPGHRQIAFINILNMGSKEAVMWLLGNFKKKDITAVIKKSYQSEWSKKSLIYWSSFFNTFPLKEQRFKALNETALEYSR